MVSRVGGLGAMHPEGQEQKPVTSGLQTRNGPLRPEMLFLQSV